MSYIYIAGREIKDYPHTFQPGEVVPDAEERFKYLEAFINSGMLYRVTDNNDYDRLPPHVYGYVMSNQETRDIIELGQAQHKVAWQKPEALEESEKVAQIQEEIYLIQAGKKEELLRRRAEAQAKPAPDKPVMNRLKPVKPQVDAMKVVAEEKAAKAVGDEYENMKKEELIKLAESRELATGGTKADLIDRLREKDAEV